MLGACSGSARFPEISVLATTCAACIAMTIYIYIYVRTFLPSICIEEFCIVWV